MGHRLMTRDDNVRRDFVLIKVNILRFKNKFQTRPSKNKPYLSLSRTISVS